MLQPQQLISSYSVKVRTSVLNFLEKRYSQSHVALGAQFALGKMVACQDPFPVPGGTVSCLQIPRIGWNQESRMKFLLCGGRGNC